MCPLSLASFKISFLSLVFSSLTLMCFFVYFQFCLECMESLEPKAICLSQKLESSSHYFFERFFCLILSLLSFWDKQSGAQYCSTILAFSLQNIANLFHNPLSALRLPPYPSFQPPWQGRGRRVLLGEVPQPLSHTKLSVAGGQTSEPWEKLIPLHEYVEMTFF